jgi:AraC family transcriptional activator of tynA and feaB
MLADVWHDSIFLVQQVCGRSRVVHYDRTAELQAGDVAVIDSQGSCSFDFSTEPTRQISLALPRSNLHDVVRLIRTTSRWAISSRIGLGQPLAALVSSIGACGTAFDADDQRLLCETLAKYVRRCLTASPSWAPTSDERLFRRISEWATAHVGWADVTPAALARELGISRRQLYRLFEAKSTTPASWIWSLRLDAASRLLTTTQELTVTDIAFAVGFKDAAHFSRAFRRRFGCSPIAHRATAGRLV